MSEKKKNEKSAPKAQGGFPSYKGRPLVRSGDTLYYGSMTEKYVVKPVSYTHLTLPTIYSV